MRRLVWIVLTSGVVAGCGGLSEGAGGSGGEGSESSGEGSSEGGGSGPYAGPGGGGSASCSMGSAGSGSGSLMQPGGNCISCHASGEGPRYTIAGTVMGTYDDATNCAGVRGVTVRVVDARGAVHVLTTNAAGNFFSRDSIPTPYTAQLQLGGNVLAMASPQSDRNCMNCHTAAGLGGAPGRMIAP